MKVAFFFINIAYFFLLFLFLYNFWERQHADICRGDIWENHIIDIGFLTNEYDRCPIDLSYVFYDFILPNVLLYALLMIPFTGLYLWRRYKRKHY